MKNQHFSGQYVLSIIKTVTDDNIISTIDSVLMEKLSGTKC